MESPVPPPCPQLTILSDRLARCAILDQHGRTQIAGPSNPNFPCHRCWREQAILPADAIAEGRLTPTLERLLRPALSMQEDTRHRAKPCLFLGDVLDRLDCHCHQRHIRACEIVGETTLVDCQRCPHYVVDDPANDWIDRRERLVLCCDLCPGDLVVMSAAIRDLHRAYPGRYATDVRTRHPEIWEHHPFLTPIPDADVAAGRARRIEMHYPLIHESNRRPVHFLEGFCDHLARELGLPSLRPTEFRGHIVLSNEERSSASPYPHPFWLVNAGTKSDYTAKQWPHESFQEVVDAFRGRITFVQVGAAEPGHRHDRLEGAVDLVGKTSLRELIRLVHHADGCLTGVSLLMHLAAAVPRARGQSGLRPCVVVAGGREPAHWEQYPGHAFLDTIGELPCCESGGCWRSRTVALDDGSPHDRSLCERPVAGAPDCMRRITPADVLRAIERRL